MSQGWRKFKYFTGLSHWWGKTTLPMRLKQQTLQQLSCTSTKNGAYVYQAQTKKKLSGIHDLNQTENRPFLMLCLNVGF